MDTILVLVSLALTAGSVLLGAKWLIAKGKLAQLKAVFKEGVDVINVAIDALDDDKITPEEVANIKKEGAEFIAAGKVLIGKE